MYRKSAIVFLLVLLTGCNKSSDTNTTAVQPVALVQPGEPTLSANSESGIIDIGAPIAQKIAAKPIDPRFVRTVTSCAVDIDDTGQVGGYYIVTTLGPNGHELTEGGISQVFLYNRNISLLQGLERPQSLNKCVVLNGKESLIGYNGTGGVTLYKDGNYTPLMPGYSKARVVGGINLQTPTNGKIMCLCGALEDNYHGFIYDTSQKKMTVEFNTFAWELWKHAEDTKPAIVPDYRGSIEGVGGGSDEIFYAIDVSQQVYIGTGGIIEQKELAHAFLMTHKEGQNDKYKDLGTLPGTEESHAVSVNSSGEVTGYCGRSPVVGKGFLYSNKNDSIKAIGTLGGSYSEPEAINEGGDIVGSSETATGLQHAFIYHKGKIIDLNDYVKGSGWELTKAFAINNKDQVCGEGRIKGERHAFLLTLKK